MHVIVLLRFWYNFVCVLQSLDERLGAQPVYSACLTRPDGRFFFSMVTFKLSEHSYILTWNGIVSRRQIVQYWYLWGVILWLAFGRNKRLRHGL